MLDAPAGIPSREWNESARIYKDLCFGLMVEQRRRIELMSGVGDDDMTDEQVESELKEIALAHVRSMPEKDRREMLAVMRAGDRGAIDVEEPT